MVPNFIKNIIIKKFKIIAVYILKIIINFIVFNLIVLKIP